MKEKINIRIDVTKIDKSKIITRSFKNKKGETITVKELSLDIVPLKETKLLKEGPTYQLYKTHFVAIQSTKEEREAKAKSTIIGEGTMFINTEERDKKVDKEADKDSMDYPEEEINPDDIPF